MRFAALAILLLAGLRAAAAAPPAIQFSGVLVADGKTKIALTDTTTGATTWVEPGKDFNGYAVARYDAKTDSVVLKKNGEEYPLSLIASKSAPDVISAPAAAVAVAPAPQPAEPPLTPTGRPTPQTPTPVVVTNPPPAPVAPAPTSVNISVAPAATPVVADPNYITREGDTLTKISAATGLSMERLQELNPGVNASALLKAGDPIRTR